MLSRTELQLRLPPSDIKCIESFRWILRPALGKVRIV